jgi:hypothetical protein
VSCPQPQHEKQRQCMSGSGPGAQCAVGGARIAARHLGLQVLATPFASPKFHQLPVTSISGHCLCYLSSHPHQDKPGTLLLLHYKCTPWPPPWSTWRSRPPLPWPPWTQVPSTAPCFAGHKQQSLLDADVHCRTSLPQSIPGRTASTDADAPRGAASPPSCRPHPPPWNTSTRSWGHPRPKRTWTDDGTGGHQHRFRPSGRPSNRSLLHGRHHVTRPRRILELFCNFYVVTNNIICTIRYMHLCNLNVIITAVIIHVYDLQIIIGVRTIRMQLILFAWFKN